MSEYVIYDFNGTEKLGRVVEKKESRYIVSSFNNFELDTINKSDIINPVVQPSLKFGDVVKIIDNYSGSDYSVHKTGSIGNVIDCIPENNGGYYYIVNAYGTEAAYYRYQLQKGHTEWVCDEEKESDTSLSDIIKSNDHIILKYKNEDVHIIHVLDNHLNKDQFNKYCMNKDMKYRYLILSGTLQPLFSNIIKIAEFYKLSSHPVKYVNDYKDLKVYELV